MFARIHGRVFAKSSDLGVSSFKNESDGGTQTPAAVVMMGRNGGDLFETLILVFIAAGGDITLIALLVRSRSCFLLCECRG
jgi:hypothetical protein